MKLELNLLKPLHDTNSVVARFCDVLDLNYPGLEETKYAVQFLLCVNTIEKSEKQKLLRKHKSNKQKEKVCENKRKAYKFLDVRKEHLCNENSCKYKKIKLREKKVLQSKETDPFEKKRLAAIKKDLNTREWTPIKRKHLIIRNQQNIMQ